jgi:hypothetical protein
MTEPTSQGAGNPSDEQELDPSELTDEELRSYFTGDANSEETPASDEPETATQEDTEVGNTTEEPTDTEEEDEQERLSKMRVRPKDDVDQQILDLYKSEGFHGTLTEATRTIKGESTPVEPAQAQASSEAPDRTQAALSEIDTKIAELNGKAKEASEDLDTAQAFALQGEIMEQRLLKIKLEGDADREKEREQARLDNAYRQKAVESRDKAFKRFPVLQDSDSVQRKQFDAFVTKKQNDPDYATVFESPKWVELMANEFAGEVDLTPPSADVSVENLNRPSRNNTKVLTSASNTSTVSKQKQITPQGVRDSMHRLDRDTLYSMLGQE